MKIYWSDRHNDYIFSNIFTGLPHSHYFLTKDMLDGLIWIEVWPEYAINLELVVEL